MSYVYFVVIIMVVSLTTTALISAVEKRLVWPYVPSQDAPPESLPAPNSYAAVAASAATEAGFLWLGTFADGKGKIYRIRYEFFLSPTGDVLALIGTGTIASIPLQATWLYTFLTDGKCLVTVDHQNAVETDLSGISDGTLAGGRGFFALLEAHRARVALTVREVKVFAAANALNEFRSSRQARIDRLCLLGYAAFLDADREAWRYSIKGALLLAFRQYFTGLRRAVFPDKVHAAGNRVP